MKDENILIIDVDDNTTSLLSDLMGRLDCKFRIVPDPETALTHLKDEHATLIMAEVSLFQTEEIVKIQDLNPEICFIFFGQSLNDFKDQINLGVSDFLSKPFGLEEAEFRLKRIILERDMRLQYQEAERELEKARDELDRKTRELELSMEDLERIKHLYKEIGNELNTTSEKLRIANNQLEIMAITDGLTEVYNHRYFMEQIHEKFEKSKKQSTPLSLLMIDIDHFKTFNDNHGHMTGDLVLKEIAQILKSSCRGEDIVARYGGEEFSVILPGTDSHEAETVAEKIRTAVEKHQTSNGDEAQRVTVSIGLDTSREATDSVNDLISSADKALYRAKAQGRNRVVSREQKQPMSSAQWFSRF